MRDDGTQRLGHVVRVDGHAHVRDARERCDPRRKGELLAHGVTRYAAKRHKGGDADVDHLG